MARRKKKRAPAGSFTKRGVPDTAWDAIVYTDGGCAINPGGPGGVGVVITIPETGEVTELSEGYLSTTNNRMEIMAILAALRNTEGNILIWSDSEYVIKCALGLFRRTKNADLWKEYDRLSAGRMIDFKWVRGHSGNQYNERCDQLASQAMFSKERKTDEGYRNAKKAGSDFFRKVAEIENRSNVAEIRVPKELDKRPHLGSRREYAEEYHVHTACAASIVDFYCTGIRNFKAYAAIKTGGMDEWSRKKRDSLVETAGSDTLAVIEEHFDDDKSIDNCLRWVCRGLSLSDAIRKVQVANEIAANALQHRG